MPASSPTSADTPTDLPRGVLRSGESPARRVYLCPRPDGLLFDPDFRRCEVLIRRADGGADVFHADVQALADWAWREGEDLGVHVAHLLATLRATRPEFAGIAIEPAAIMGVVNVTPDSFSDGGETADAESALARGRAHAAAGALLIDVGGESTRPGAAPVAVDAEIARVQPVVRGLVADGLRVSIDTRREAVMAAALEAGATVVNDVSAFAGDPRALGMVAERGAATILMHMQGEPATMQHDPRYACAPLDIYDFLAERVAACMAAGIPRERIAVDPGIGFGKTVAHNVEILARLALYRGLGCAVAVGVSRKSFIARLGRDAPPSARLGGSLAAALAAVRAGAHLLRVHDVAPTRQALDVWGAIGRGWPN